MTYVPTVLEGNYTEWAHKWTMDLTGGMANDDLFGLYIDDYEDIISVSWKHKLAPSRTRFARYNIADSSIIFESESGSNYASTPDLRADDVAGVRGIDKYQRLSPATSCRSYILLNRGSFVIEMWRSTSGTALWSRDISIDLADIQELDGFSVSPTGKYIALIGYYDSEEWYNMIMLYEGS